MTRPAYNPIPDAWVDVDSPLSGIDPADPQDLGLMGTLRNNVNALRIAVLGPTFAEASNSETSFGAASTLFSLPVHLPTLADYSGIVRRITGRVEVRVSAAATDGRYRLEANGVGGPQSAVIQATTYQTIELTLDLDTAWQGTTFAVNVQGKRDGASGTVFAQVSANAAWRLEY